MISVFSCFASDPPRLVAMATICVLPLWLFSGIFIALPDAPGFLRWIYYINPQYYGFVAGMQIAYTPCPTLATASKNNPIAPCQRTVAFDLFGIDDALPAGVNVALLLTVAAVFVLAGWASLVLRVRYFRK